METGLIRAGWPMWVAAIVLALTLTLAAFGAYIGYFGGPVLTMFPATTRPRPARAHIAAVVLSGDMGFTIGMGRQISARLAEDGIAVIGFNSLTYFRHGRTPAEVQTLIAALARRAMAFGHADGVILIGQSLGADMLQAGLAGMSGGLRAKVRMVALVVPTDTLIFRASPAELIGLAKADAQALPTARQLNWTPVTCIYGQEETDSLCPIWKQPNVHVVALPGGHLLHGDVEAVHRVLSAAIDSPASPPNTGAGG